MGKKIKTGTRGTLYMEVARLRLEDARVLLENRRYHGALYLVGYSVECALKWAITKRFETLYLSGEFETHDLQKLLGQSGLTAELRKDTPMLILFSALVDEWGPNGRYTARHLDEVKTKRLYNQAKQVYLWIIEHTL